MITPEDCQATIDRLSQECPTASSLLEWATNHQWDEEAFMGTLAGITGSAAQQMGVPDMPEPVTMAISLAIAQGMVLGFELASAQHRTNDAMPNIDNVLGGDDAAA